MKANNPYWNDSLFDRMIDKGFDGADIHYWSMVYMDSTFPGVEYNKTKEAEFHIQLDYMVPKNG